MLTPCPVCLELVLAGELDREALQPLPPKYPPRARTTGEPCCFDCQAAETLLRLGTGITELIPARIAVGNERREHYRLPASMALGLIMDGLVRRGGSVDDLNAHLDWLDSLVELRQEREPAEDDDDE